MINRKLECKIIFISISPLLKLFSINIFSKQYLLKNRGFRLNRINQDNHSFLMFILYGHEVRFFIKISLILCFEQDFEENSWLIESYN